MSEEGGFGLSVAERFFGLLVLVIGLVAMFYTLTSAESLLAFTGFFGFLSFILIILGVVLITAKVE